MLESSKESLDKLKQETGESKHESNEAKIAEIKQALMSKIPIITPDFKNKQNKLKFFNTREASTLEK